MSDFIIDGKQTFLNSQQVRYTAEDRRTHTAVIRGLNGENAHIEASVDGKSEYFEEVPYNASGGVNTWFHVD